MTDRHRLENIINNQGVNAADRIDCPDGIILIADGKSDLPEYMFMTVWAFGRNENDLSVARPLYFRPWGKNGPNTLEVRMEAARQDAHNWRRLRH